MLKYRRHLFALLIFLFVLTPVWAQYEPHHPELEWKTVESEHFIYNFHPGTEWSVAMAMEVAETIYPHVTGLYDWEPKEKTQIIIQDTDDYANGGAYYFDNKILIWASPLEFDLRGNHQWMWNVLTHEFSHIVSLGASMKYPINIPMFYIRWLDREEPIKENVILENPKGIASVPIANSIVPMWWAEGVAQYQYEDATHDYWDSHRDMILRDAALNNRIMSWNEVSHFGHPGIGNEIVYNTGYAFASYLAERFGARVHAEIADAARNKFRLSFDRIIKNVTGIGGKELYLEFTDQIQAQYLNRTNNIREHLSEGEKLFTEGPGNFLPSWSPDGEHFVFQSSTGFDYLSFNFLYTLKDGKAKMISKDRVRGNVAWSPDASKLYFAQRQKANIYGSTWFDLMEYDFETKKLRRLTEDARVYSVAVDPRGNMYLIRVNDGTHNIYRFDPLSGNMENLSDFSHGEQVFMISAAPDGQSLYFDMAVNHGRDIYRMDLENRQVTPLIFDPRHDIRTPFIAPDGKELYYASDRSGIFNIYCMNLADPSDEDRLISNVRGAAMYPALNPLKRELAFSIFSEGRFVLHTINADTSIARDHSHYKDYSFPTIGQPCAESCISVAKDYEYQFSKLFFMPFVQYDYDAFKFGLIAYQDEILNKLNLFAMADVNHRGDYDINMRLDFNQLLPRFFAELYAVGLSRTDTISYLDYYTMEQKVRFSLYEVMLGMHYTWRSKHYFEVTGTQGSYTSNIKGYFDDPSLGLQKFVPYSYYKGQRLEFRYRADFTRPHWQSNVSPTRGWRINDAVIAYDFNQFIDDFRVTDYGTYTETYTKHYTPRIDLDADLFIPLPGTRNSSLYLNLVGGMMFNTEIDSFFNYYAGGMPGLRGYPFYTIEGARKVVLTSGLRFPVSKRLGLNLEPFSFEYLYMGLYHQIGDAWTKGSPSWKQDIGLEARIGGHSWYDFPLAMRFDLVYALNKIQYDEFDATRTVGHNFRFYWTILFDF